jgi:hypothetical protein
LFLVSLFVDCLRVFAQEGKMGNTVQAVEARAAMDAAVVRFHERLSADPDLSGYFSGMDLRRILERQMTLFALVAGGQ